LLSKTKTVPGGVDHLLGRNNASHSGKYHGNNVLLSGPLSCDAHTVKGLFGWRIVSMVGWKLLRRLATWLVEFMRSKE
jgi:hypothetical protein